MRIGVIAPPFLPVPPPRYGGTERIVSVVAEGLVGRGHDVTLFAAGDSEFSGRLVATVPESTWKAGTHEDQATLMARTLEFVDERAGDFDLFHSHIEWHGFPFARSSTIPVVSTLHGRIDLGATAEVIGGYPDVPLIAISDKQRSFWPEHNWLATIHHGLDFGDVQLGHGYGRYLLFVGRLTPEKGVDSAIELARRVGLPLIVAAKAIEPHEIQHYHEVVEPAERAGMVKFLGEVGPTARDRLLGDALATVMLGDWPEPFGLVAIESLATGTPVIALPAGALPEIVRDGIDGFVVEDVDAAVAAVAELGSLDRQRIQADALSRFSSDRMVDEYEAVFARLVDVGTSAPGRDDAGTKVAKTPLGVP